MNPGACHNSTAFASTRLGQISLDPTYKLTAASISAGHCLVADDAYAESEVLAVSRPGSGRGDRWKDAYDFY